MFKKMVSTLFIFAVAATFVFAGSIDSKDVTRIVSTLASDDMQGRQAGSEYANKAAAFIVDEFKKAGLQPMEGMDSYLQTLTMFQIAPKSRRLVVNGASVPTDDFIAVVDRPETHITDASALKLFHLKAGDDPRSQMRQFFRMQEPYLLVIDPAHRETFNQVVGYMGGERMRTKLNETRLSVIMVGDVAELSSLDLHVVNQINEPETSNVIGVLPGTSKKDEMVLFSAHYDHLGTLPAVNGDTIANGADDDASGTAAVITLAKYFKAQGGNARTLVFVAFTAEEAGGFGSQLLAETLPPERIIAGINIEMIGKPSKFGPKSAFITGFDLSDVGPILQKSVEGKPFSFHPDPYPAQNLFYRSDNASFARLGVPFHSLSSSQIDKDQYYHTVDDEIETLDFEHMTQIIQGIAEGTELLVNGEATPARLKGAAQAK